MNISKSNVIWWKSQGFLPDFLYDYKVCNSSINGARKVLEKTGLIVYPLIHRCCGTRWYVTKGGAKIYLRVTLKQIIDPKVKLKVCLSTATNKTYLIVDRSEFHQYEFNFKQKPQGE